MIEAFINFFVNIIYQIGYLGVFILMVLESMIAPVPSEAVMPPAGFLVAEGRFILWVVIFVSGIASLVGSLISYAIGYYGGRPFLEKYGKFFLLEHKSLNWTERWFSKHGTKTIFISRFIPIIRHVISIPAGMGKMELKRFCTFTFIGATVWNSFLVFVGMWLKENWKNFLVYVKQIDIAIILIIIILISIFVYKKLIKRKRKIRKFKRFKRWI